MVPVPQGGPGLPKKPQVRRQNRRDPDELRSTYQQSYWYGSGDESDEAAAGDTADDRPRVPGPGSASGAQAADGTPVDLVSAAAAVDLDCADERKLWAVAAVAARNAERARQRLAEPSRTESVPGQLDLPGLPQARRLGKDTTR
jgi:hypothetical protein